MPGAENHKLSGSVCQLKGYSLVREVVIGIRINGRDAGSISSTPQDLKELTAGWLFTEGHIEKCSQINDIAIHEDDHLVEVTISDAGPCEGRAPSGAGSVEQCAPSGAGSDEQCAPSGAGSNADSAPAEESEEVSAKSGRTRWSSEDLIQIRAAFDHEPPLFARTHASHSCMVVRHCSAAAGDSSTATEEANSAPPLDGQTAEILYRSEDAGRHSALDKAIGWALLNNVDLSECMLFGSGRTSTKMAAKAGRAGASALAGLGAVTAEAVELAKEYDMALIGYVLADSAVWFNGAAGDVPDHDSNVT